MKQIIKKYLRALAEGSYGKIIALFRKDAVVFSPLYGKIRAELFYKDLFEQTKNSEIKLLNIFEDKKKMMSAGYFQYGWMLKNKKRDVFDCVDIFIFDKNNKIKELRIIYDTARIRPTFENLKKKC